MQEFMTLEDKNEIKEMLKSTLDLHQSKQEEQFAIIDMKLDQIEAQTTLTNGRVTKLEGKCILYDQDTIKKAFLRKWLLGGLAICATLTGIITAIIKLM